MFSTTGQIFFICRDACSIHSWWSDIYKSVQLQQQNQQQEYKDCSDSEKREDELSHIFAFKYIIIIVAWTRIDCEHKSMNLCSTVQWCTLFDGCGMSASKNSDLTTREKQPTLCDLENTEALSGMAAKGSADLVYLPCQHAPDMHKCCMSYLNILPSPPNIKNKTPLNSLPSSACYNLLTLAWLAFISRTHMQRHSILQQYVSSGRLSIYWSFKPDLFLHTVLGSSCLDFWSLRLS